MPLSMHFVGDAITHCAATWRIETRIDFVFCQITLVFVNFFTFAFKDKLCRLHVVILIQLGR